MSLEKLIAKLGKDSKTAKLLKQAFVEPLNKGNQGVKRARNIAIGSGTAAASGAGAYAALKNKKDE